MLDELIQTNSLLQFECDSQVHYRIGGKCQQNVEKETAKIKHLIKYVEENPEQLENI